MAELKTREEIMERIAALQQDLDTLVMSAEKEYRTRFEVSNLKYTLLQMEMGEMRKIIERQENRLKKCERILGTDSTGKNQTGLLKRIAGPRKNDMSVSIKELQRQIESLEFRLQTEVFSTDKERELREKINHLKRVLKESEEGIV
jgi:uncharacterized protein YPO0396